MRSSAAALLATGVSLFVAGCGGDEDLSAVPITRTARLWLDSSRPTATAAERVLRVLIWRRAVVQRLPLLVMAHGVGGLPEKFEAFARAVSAAGYIVAAPAFPHSNQNAPDLNQSGFRDVVHQPGDVSYVIDQLLSANNDTGDSLHDSIAAEQIALLGHSLGGLTAVAVTRKQCCRDPRIQAAVLVAAVGVPHALVDPIFGDDLIAMGPPTLIIHGTADASVPYETAAPLFEAIAPPRVLLGLVAAGHSEALESQTEPPIAARAASQRATIAFLNAVFRGDQHTLQAALADLASAGEIMRADL